MCLHHMILAEDKYAIKKKFFKLPPEEERADTTNENLHPKMRNMREKNLK